MYEGYLTLGGSELTNVARFKKYIENVPSFPWVKNINSAEADALRVALGDAPYVDPATDNAPWYDPGVPASANFWGMFITDISGDEDSTRSNTTTQSVLNGGSIGRTRYATRQLRVKAVIAARDDLALEAGLTWLNAAIDPDDCSGDCGSMTLCGYAAVPGYLDTCDGIPYAEARVRTNDLIDPDFLLSTGNGWGTTSATFTPASFANLRVTAAAAIGTALIYSNPFSAAIPGDRISGLMTVANLNATALSFNIEIATYTAGGTTIATYPGPTISIPAGGSADLRVDGATAPAGTAFYRLILRNRTALVVGNQFTVSKALGERAAVAGPYFSGSTPNTNQASSIWIGPANNSPSRLFTAGMTVDRHLNEVSAISGVSIDEKRKLATGVYREIEFGLEAGTPFFFNNAVNVINSTTNLAGISTYYDAGKLVAINHVHDPRVLTTATTRTQASSGTVTVTAQDNQATTAGIPIFAQPDNRMTKILVTALAGYVDHGPGRQTAPQYLRTVIAGRQYTASCHATANGPGQLILRMNWFDAAGNDMGSSVTATAQTIDGNSDPTLATIKRYWVSGVCPAGAVYAITTARLSGPGGTSAPSGAAFWIDWWQIEQTSVVSGQPFGYPTDWFDGQSVDTFYDDFQADGVIGNSSSFHFLKWLCDYSLFNGVYYKPGYTPLLDPLCPLPPAAPAPPVIASCVPAPGRVGWNRSYFNIPPMVVPENGIAAPTISIGVISTGGAWQFARQIRVRFYANPGNLAATDIDPCSYCAELTISYADESTTFVMDGETQSTTATINGTSGIPADSYLYGADGGPVVWPELSCGIPYVMTVDQRRDASANLAVTVDTARRF